MTERQRETLDFIIGFTLVKGYSPSYADIGAALKLRSLSTVFKHVHSLDGIYLDLQHNQTRNLKIRAEFIKEYRDRKAKSGHPCPACKGTGFIGEVPA